MSDRVQVWPLAGPLKDIHRLVPKPLLVVQLEGEPLHQSEVLSALEQVFIKDLSFLCSVNLFPSILTSLLVTAAEKHPPPCFTIGMVPGFPQACTWHSGQRVQSWYHQTR